MNYGERILEVVKGKESRLAEKASFILRM